ncbi:alpha/beta hydrolase [Erythrobacter sp. BLCC-B19]|uniref:alpha/beta hydrolase n=1 Tax=Erythrobacter sp. BLCC-B19 TaxID=3025315 RepID=UPI00235FB3E7|nr:alpha/beta hydrolase-fold protein [Erythrobacter sp. BLCC-B19]WDA41050.1 alpha/beta hydrolase-fold protein [Erythrobacter sp. BLCC-B19]
MLVPAAMLSACSAAPASDAAPAAAPVQRGEGQAYELLGTQVFDVPDPASGIAYQVFVSLPPSYAAEPERRYPVVYVTDADYGFPMLRAIGRRMNGEGPRIAEFILVGLSYGKGEDPMASRRRDYTPTGKGASGAPAGAVHGQSLRYRDYLREAVLPFVEARFRAMPERRVYVGHSYGGLLGAQILMTQPDMFSGYVLGSPSFWFDRKYLLREAPALLGKLQAIDADVYMYVGEFEAQRIGDNRYQQEVDMVADNAAFAALLQDHGFAGLRLQSDVLADEDHLSVAPRGFTRGLLHTLAVPDSVD